MQVSTQVFILAVFSALFALAAYADDKEAAWNPKPVVNESRLKVLLESAAEPMFRHPVIHTTPDPNMRFPGAEQAKEEWVVMSMSKQQLRAAAPKQTGLIHTGCPHCNAGTKNADHDFNDHAQLPRCWDWSYDPLKPDRMTCRKCGEVFPDNSKFPMNHMDVFHNTLGEKVNRGYWLDTSPDKRGERKRFPKYYLEGMHNTAQHRWYADQLGKLANAYLITQDEDFAYTAAIMFDAMCDVFPHWIYMDNYAHGYRDYRPGMHMESEMTRTNTRRGESMYGPANMLKVYDVMFNSDGFKKYSREIGVDLRAKYLANVVKHIRPNAFGEGPLPDAGKWEQACPGHSGLTDGRILHDPRYFRRFIDHMNRVPFKVFGSDGGYFEGLGYTCLQLNPMMGMRDLNGYSDPPSFKVPPGESRYSNWQYPTGHYEQFYKKTYGLLRDIQLPTGIGPAFNDSGGSFPSASYLDQTPKTQSVNHMFHNLKHTVLGDGEGHDQIQVHLGWGEATKHGHSDTLGLQIFAQGHLLIDDITYPKHRLRAAYSSTLTHNTVTIDKSGQTPSPNDGDPVLYEPRFTGLSAVRINAERAYCGNCDIYARTLISNTSDIKHPYVVDLFRVRGGKKTRDYMLLSCYKRKSSAKFSVPTTKLSGDRPLMRPDSRWGDEGRDIVQYDDPYGIFTNVRRIDAEQDFTLQYTLDEPWVKRGEDGKIVESDNGATEPVDLYYDPALPEVGTRHHFIGRAGMEGFLVDLTRRAEYGPLLKQPQMPQFILRHSGDNGDAWFTVVHEPYKGKPAIKQVTQLSDDKTDDKTVALEIEFLDGRRDTILISADETPMNFKANGITTDSRLAVISRPVGRKAQAWMVGGTRLEDRNSGVDLASPKAQFSGRIVKSFREWDGDAFNGFEIDGDLPPRGDRFYGAWVMLKNRGIMEKLPNCNAPTGMEEWYQKYISRSRRQVEEIGLEKTDHPQVARYLRGKRAYEASFNAGAGWGFQVARVFQDNGKTYIETLDDHGLMIDGTKARERFYPHRDIGGAPTTWWLNEAVSTEPMKDLRPRPQVVSGVVAEQPIDAKPGLLHIVSTDGKIASVRVLDEGKMQHKVFRPEGKGLHTFCGLLVVPKTGEYTFHFRPGGDGAFKLGEKTLLDYRNRIGSPVPRVIHVHLEKGFAPLEFTATMQGTKYWKASNDFEWETHGQARRPFEFNDFIYTPAMQAASR